MIPLGEPPYTIQAYLNAGIYGESENENEPPQSALFAEFPALSFDHAAQVLAAVRPCYPFAVFRVVWEGVELP